MDLGRQAETTIMGVTLEGRLCLVNVLDRHNPFDWSLDPTGPTPTPAKRRLPSRRLSVLLGVHF